MKELNLLTFWYTIRFEFFAFPEYFQDVPATNVCLENLKDAAGGTSPPIRIGGTTQ